MANKMKKYLVTAELWYDYTDQMEEEWEDCADTMYDFLHADGVRWRMIGALENMGFNVDIRVVENKEQ
jgi:hypothetical protein